MESIGAAALRSKQTHIIPGKLKVSELFFTVPKDYSKISAGTLEIFCRSVSRHEARDKGKQKSAPWLCYLQGGPGGACPPPERAYITDFLLDKGYQILYMDQRGTGLSSPITAATLALQGSHSNQADYAKLFRADNIVRDAEAIRQSLTQDKWSIFGQSFGGFCVLTYLSKYPHGLREAFTTGGLAPIASSADEVYTKTFSKLIERNKAYYAKYPEDVETIHDLAFYIKSKQGLSLPSGGVLTVRVLLTLGSAFGAHGGLDRVHQLVLRMKSDLAQFGFITRPTLGAVESSLPFTDDSVIYSILHEPIYCQGTASKWAADRIGKTLPQFQWLAGSPQVASSVRDHPLYFSGEMVYPFLFETFPDLQKLSAVADLLATYSYWPDLYDEWQLARNEVPVYSATFIDDMYVDFELANKTAKLVKGCKQFITNSMYHDAIRSKTEEVLKELFVLKEDSID